MRPESALSLASKGWGSGTLRRLLWAIGILTAVIVVAALTRIARGSAAIQGSSKLAVTESEDNGALSETALELLTQSGAFEKQQEALSVALERSKAECMHGAGYQYPLPPEEGDSSGAVEPDRSSLTFRKEHGYGLGERAPDGPSLGAANDGDPLFELNLGKDPNEVMTALSGSLDDRGEILLPDGVKIGYPQSGCIAAARRRLAGGDLKAWVEMAYAPDSLASRISKQVQAGSAWKDQLRLWSACLRRHGLAYAYASPAEAVSVLSSKYNASVADVPSLQTEERRVAVVDYECQIETRMNEHYVALCRGAARSLDLEDRLLLERIARFRTQALQRATHVGRRSAER